MRWSAATRTALGLLTAFVAPPAGAYEYTARGNFGLYQATETYATPVEGTTSNDGRALLASTYLDVTKIGSYHNEFTLDLRDKYDSFGRVDQPNTRLVADNTPQLRQLAYKYPYESSSLAWSLGRFPVADASVLGNDGAEIGYKIRPTLRLGAFGGLYPEQIDGKPVPVALEEHQAGIYTTYQDHGTTWGKNTYATTSFVLRQPNAAATPSLTVPQAAAPVAPDPTQPVVVNESQPAANYVFWYTNIVHQPNPETRFTYLAHIDLQPQAHLRNLWASAFHQVTPRVSATISVLHLDLAEYERQRDLSDVLPTSTYNQVRVESKIKLNRLFQLNADVADGERGLDGKSRLEANAKGVATSLAGGHISAFAGGGYRKNYLSHDDIARAGASYYGSKLEFDLAQQYIIENYDTGVVLHQLITDVSAGYVLTESLLGSLTVEYARDEQVTIVSGLATLGFRLGSKQFTPIRDRAPRLERL